MGTMASTVNPFSTVIASNTAGIDFTNGIILRLSMLIIGLTICIVYVIKYAQKVKKDPTKSLIYEQKEELESHFLSNHKSENIPNFTIQRKLILIILHINLVPLIPIYQKV